MRTLLIFVFFICYGLTRAQNHAKDYYVFLGDTINVIDERNQKQGRWVVFGKDQKGIKNKLLKHNQVINDGVYINNEKNGVWKSYHSNTNKLKSEITYVKGEINGRVKLFNEKGKITHEGMMKGGDWVGDYYVYNAGGEKLKKNSDGSGLKKAMLMFSGIITKNGRPIEDVEVTIEKNEIFLKNFKSPLDGQFAAPLELQNVYVISFSKKGFHKNSVLINTYTDNIFDTTQYKLADWKVQMTDNFAASATGEIFSFIINKPSNKIYFNKRKKEFNADGSYEHLLKKQLNGISNSTKLIVASTMETNKKLEIENLRIEQEAKLKEIELLQKEQLLQQANLKEKENELLAKKLEAEKKEITLALLEQEKKVKELKIQEQQNEALQRQLEDEKKARQIDRLNATASRAELDAINQKKLLTEAQVKIRNDRLREEMSAKELDVANKEKAAKETELEAKQRSFNIVLVGLGVVGIMMFFLYRNITQKKKANELLARQKLEMENQKHEIEEKSKIIEEKNEETHQSILYAKRIQHAILPPPSEIDPYLKEYFILYKSKDIVSGDFYFFSSKYAHDHNHIIIAAADCTGHGVPGAFMSMIGNEKLKDAVDISYSPGKIIEELNVGLKGALRQSGETGTRDGMDISILTLPADYDKHDTINVEFAGANRPLWVIKNNSGEVIEYKATKHAVGGFTADDQPFALHQLAFEKKDTLYLFSDGYADQFGGTNAKKMMTKRFKDILLEISPKNMNEQKEYLANFFEEWKGANEQVDDILVIGIRL
ncbi:MAG: SpoIIE family protein phosphatase [Bacteroidetes bacterium]|nr:SpoIIE family protein phosphatase [Bacteroidota bacterium]